MEATDEVREVAVIDAREIMGAEEYDRVDATVPLSTIRSFLVCEDPNMRVIPHFLTDSEVDHLLELAEDYWTPSQVGAGTYKTKNEDEDLTKVVSKNRTSYSCMLRSAHTETVRNIELRLSMLAGMDIDFLERLNLVRYAPGQFFNEHHDGRFRPITIFVYLNDLPEEDEGETQFPRLGLKFTPRKGTAVMWSNIWGPQQQDMRMVHQGLPPKTAVKYGVNCFFNDKPLKARKDVDDFPDDPNSRPPQLSYDDVYTTIDPVALLQKYGNPDAPAGKIQAFAINAEPKVTVVPGFLSSEEIEACIARIFPDTEDGVDVSIIHRVQDRVALLTGISKDYLTMCYSRSNTSDMSEEVPQGTTKVVFIHLDEGHKGQGTRFATLGLQVKARAGCALMIPVVERFPYHFRAPKTAPKMAVICSFQEPEVDAGP